MKRILALLITIFISNFASAQQPNKSGRGKTPEPNRMAASLLNELKIQKVDYALDQYGFPYYKGQFFIAIKPGFRTQAQVDTIAKNIERKVIELYLSEGKPNPQGKIFFEKCGCFDYILLKIIGDVLGDPKVATSGGVVNGVQNFTPNYIGYSEKALPDAVGINYHDPANAFAQAAKYESITTVAQKVSVQNGEFAKIAILDTGLDISFTNPFKLYQFIWKRPSNSSTFCINDDTLGYNFSDETVTNNPNLLIQNRGNGEIYDDNGHGSHIATNIINLEITEKNKNIFKFNSNNLRILPVKTHNRSGRGSLFSVVCGIKYATDAKVNVINASWGFIHNEESVLSPLKDAIINATSNNIIFVAAAGNDGKKIENHGFEIYPAMFHYTDKKPDNLIVVGSFEKGKKVEYEYALYSNRNAKHIDIIAKGTTFSKFNFNGLKTIYSSGTSFSTGLVSGVAGRQFLINSSASTNTINTLNNYGVNPSPVYFSSYINWVRFSRLLGRVSDHQFP